MRHRALIVVLTGICAAPGLGYAAPPGRAGIAEIPPVPPLRLAHPPGPPLRRSHDLIALFSGGAGDWRPAGHGPARGLALPWTVADGRENAVRLVSWPGARPEGHDEEGMVALVLGDGERWCSPPLTFPAGARLRFDATSLAGRPSLEVRLGAAPISTFAAAAPQPLAFESQGDLALTPGTAPLCVAAHGGTLGLGEARVLVPDTEPFGSPRWIVLFVFDTFRGDLLSSPEATRTVPSLAHLAAQARVYRRAVSVGSHTLAAMTAVQTGRDPLRIDPHVPLLLAWGPLPPAPAEAVAWRPNLPLSRRLQDAGYHTVMLGHNAYLSQSAAYARYSIQGDSALGTNDNVARMGPLLSRYADERVAAVVWISAAHALSITPRRLYDALGCAALEGLAEQRCRYEARAAHADEALGSFEDGLARAALAPHALRAVFADHGEQFADGTPTEGPDGSGWPRSDLGHGHTTDWTALHVPLVLRGPGIVPGVWEEPVSTLDVVPTVERLLGLPAISAQDGVPLPLSSSPRPQSRRRLVSYGFCSHTDDSGTARFVWWDAACGPRRLAGSGAPLDYRSELWHGSSLVATTRRPNLALHDAQLAHARWILDRLPGEALLLDCGGLGGRPTRLVLTVPEGRIVDWGPSGTAAGFAGLRQVRATGEHRLEVLVDGYRGRFAVMTQPERAAVALEIEGEDAPVVFVGPRQLPLPVRDGVMEPSRFPSLFVSDGAPAARSTDAPALRLWWQPWRGTATGNGPDSGLAHMERVLRAWGYIR